MEVFKSANRLNDSKLMTEEQYFWELPVAAWVPFDARSFHKNVFHIHRSSWTNSFKNGFQSSVTFLEQNYPYTMLTTRKMSLNPMKRNMVEKTFAMYLITVFPWPLRAI